jgi:uncharacterized membrane protein
MVPTSIGGAVAGAVVVALAVAAEVLAVAGAAVAVVFQGEDLAVIGKNLFGSKFLKSKTLNLTPLEIQKIAQSIKHAEQDTYAEILPMVVGEAHTYPEAYLRLGLIMGFLGSLGVYLVHAFFVNFVSLDWTMSTSFHPLTFLFWQLPGFLLGPLFCFYFPSLRWLMTLSSERSAAAKNKSHQCLAENLLLNKTVPIPGVLILVLKFERKVLIISTLPNQDETDFKLITTKLVNQIKMNQLTEGLCGAINEIGEFLKVKHPKDQLIPRVEQMHASNQIQDAIIMG